MDLQVVVAASSMPATIVDSAVVPVSQDTMAILSPVDSLREGLIQSTVDQFFTTLDHCIQLIIFNGQPFSLLQPLLDHIIESIRRLGGDTRAEPFAAKVLALEHGAANLRNAENIDMQGLLHVTLAAFRLEQTREIAELKAKKEKATANYNLLQSAYAESSNAYLASEAIVRLAKDDISEAEKTIQKAQAVIAGRQKVIEAEEAKMSELSVRNYSMFAEIGDLHKMIDSFVVEHNQRLQITDDELQRKALESAQNSRISALEVARENLRELSRRP